MIQQLKGILRLEGYKIYDRPYELNIVGFRSNNVRSNSFDDDIYVFYKLPNGKWNYHVFPATTDPGTYWLQNPSRPQGTAILKEGQYEGAYGIALHGGNQVALCQIHKPVTVIRDYDRNAYLDFFNGKKETGMFGINIHRARFTGTTKSIDAYSAGCQVFAIAEQFSVFMQLCSVHRSLYGNKFTYSLIDFRAKRRLVLKRIAYGASLLGFGAMGYLAYYDFFQNNRKRKLTQLNQTN